MEVGGTLGEDGGVVGEDRVEGEGRVRHWMEL